MLVRDVVQDAGDEYVNELDKQVIKSLFEGIEKIKKEAK